MTVIKQYIIVVNVENNGHYFQGKTFQIQSEYNVGPLTPCVNIRDKVPLTM